MMSHPYEHISSKHSGMAYDPLPHRPAANFHHCPYCRHNWRCFVGCWQLKLRFGAEPTRIYSQQRTMLGKPTNRHTNKSGLKERQQSSPWNATIFATHHTVASCSWRGCMRMLVSFCSFDQLVTRLVLDLHGRREIVRTRLLALGDTDGR